MELSRKNSLSFKPILIKRQPKPKKLLLPLKKRPSKQKKLLLKNSDLRKEPPKQLKPKGYDLRKRLLRGRDWKKGLRG